MRVGNLIDLRLGETIRKYGEGADAQWVIDVPGEKVKNRQPARYTLLPESGRLIEEYLALAFGGRWVGVFEARSGLVHVTRGV